jgi:TonB family protein
MSIAAAQSTAAPTPGAKAAVDAVAKVFTWNPLAKLEATHKPLPTTGNWSAQMKIEGEVPTPCQSSVMSCVRVFYRVPEVGVVCSWTVGFVTDAATQPGDVTARQVRTLIVDEDANAALYTMKRAWVKGDAPVRAVHTVGAEYPPIAKVTNSEGVVSVLMIVGPDGKVRDMQIGYGPAMLQQAALDAAKQWRFEPVSVGNQRTNFQTYAIFTFKARTGEGATVSYGFWIGDGSHETSSSTNQRSLQATSPTVVGSAWVQCSKGVECVAAPQ